MKKILIFGTLVTLLAITVSCKKNNQSFISDCGNTSIYGPVRYYLTPYDKSLFKSYILTDTLHFIDTITNETARIYCRAGGTIWDDTTDQSENQGDTVNFGEHAGIAFNWGGGDDIGSMEYNFSAYPNKIDSIRISICGGNPFNQFPTHCSSWYLNLVDTNKINLAGSTPYNVLDSIRFLTRTFYNVYLLQKGNSFSPTDSSNNCYYTKENGIIAFTDKRYSKFWIRTNY